MVSTIRLYQIGSLKKTKKQQLEGWYQHCHYRLPSLIRDTTVCSVSGLMENNQRRRPAGPCPCTRHNPALPTAPPPHPFEVRRSYVIGTAVAYTGPWEAAEAGRVPKKNILFPRRVRANKLKNDVIPVIDPPGGLAPDTLAP